MVYICYHIYMITEQTRVNRKLVRIDKRTDDIVRALVVKLDLGERGYSAALRMIIREWDELTNSTRAEE